MRWGAYATWGKRTKVYHRSVTSTEATEQTRWGERVVSRASCGAVQSVRGVYRAEHGTEHHAKRLGLRRCSRCLWPRTT